MEHLRLMRWTRRTLGFAAGGFAGTLARSRNVDGAKARKKRKRKRKRGGTSPSACARACGTACTFCFQRAAGSLLCGDGAGVACDEACTSDDQCTDPLRRYCLERSEDSVSGTTAELCLTAGGHCAQVNVCEA